MQTRNIVVIGASAGGFEAIKKLTDSLPADFPVAIFIVWHMSPNVTGVLPKVINKQKKLPAVNAVDRAPIQPGHIYIAPPDRHLTLEKGFMRVTRGPKENRFRPAVDPLFRSAAAVYGTRVVGVILSGALDDGTAGLWAIKQKRGIAVVQDPEDAEVQSMPLSALQEVNVDYVVPVSEMGELLSRLCSELIPDDIPAPADAVKDELTDREINISIQEDVSPEGTLFGPITAFTCPDCHGALSALNEDGRIRYRCHTGHAFSAASLLAAISENIEKGLWDMLRGLEENINLLNYIGDRFAEKNQPAKAAMYFKKAQESKMYNQQIHQILQEMGNLNIDVVKEGGEGNQPKTVR